MTCIERAEVSPGPLLVNLGAWSGESPRPSVDPSVLSRGLQ